MFQFKLTSSSRRRAVLAAVCILLSSAAGAEAHEFWIEPATFQPQAGVVLPVELRLGERFAGEVSARDPDLIEQFVIAGPGGDGPVLGRSGGKVSLAKIEGPGLHIIGYRSRRSRNELPAERFESYLQEEGLEFIIPQRAERDERSRPGRELFSRCAKSLICASGDCSGAHDRVLGYPLELVPLQNPAALRAGDDFAVRVLHGGSPLPGARLVAVRRHEPHAMSSAKTDSQGQAVLRMEEPGVWMITSIHMVRAAAGLDAEWESFWASLTFEIPPAAPAEDMSAERGTATSP